MKIRDDIALYGKLAALRLGLVTCRIETTSDCFQKCQGCISWRDHLNTKIKGEFTLSGMVQLMHELKQYSMFEHVTLTGGDPQKWQALESFLSWFIINKRSMFKQNVRLQINTAMAIDVINPSLWNKAVDRVLVSMDACTPELYQRIRGDSLNTPEIIATRLLELNHPGLAFMVTVYPENQEGFVNTICWLNELHIRRALSIRRIQVLAAIGSRKSNQDEKFWNKWRKDKEKLKKTPVPISFYGDSILETREICNAPEVRNVRCWASQISLHVKATGDVYPCCMIGGEAIDTYTPFCLGNVHQELLANIYTKKCAQKNYYPGSPCLETCQYKQLQINLAGEKAANTVLSMP